VLGVSLDPAGNPGPGPIEEPEGGGTLVSVLACGLCGSDVEKIGRAAPGTVLGHEVVAEHGREGRVVLVHHLPCGGCPRCLAGHETTCAAFAAATIIPGGFAERVRAAAWLPLPDGIDDATGTFTEPLACVLRALERVPRGRVRVVGCGFVGLLFVQALLARGDEPIAFDPRADRVALARSLGASAGDGAAGGAVLCAHDGLGAALSALEPGGTLLVFAAPAEPVAVPLDLVYRRELRLEGARSATPRHMEQSLALLPALERLPVLELPLARFAEGVAAYRAGDAVKVVFRP
jgi:L-iditol 2-dehydrogenase